MCTIQEAMREQRDEVDVAKVEGYLNQLILWMRILIIAILVVSVITIVLRNFFRPSLPSYSKSK